jgi:hypothetical protein
MVCNGFCALCSAACVTCCVVAGIALLVIAASVI